jgi:hypothetical protein
MFIETYYEERPAFPTSLGELVVPYPELTGEVLSLWQSYLLVSTKLEDAPYWLRDNMPGVILEQLGKAQKTNLFDRIEIWTRSGDPMAVGVTGGEHTRYFSIVRWGDAKLTLEQVKKRLRAEKWLFRLLPVAIVVIFLVGIVTLALFADPRQFPELAQKGLYPLYQGGF